MYIEHTDLLFVSDILFYYMFPKSRNDQSRTSAQEIFFYT